LVLTLVGALDRQADRREAEGAGTAGARGAP
jgi:hypothetical protein